MLVELTIKDFAIIDSLSLSFGRGLNIFTGETGAGKSIIMDAISLILGERASNELIRANSEEAQVEAMFDVSDYGGIEATLAEAGIPHSGDLVIKRVIQRAGRNRIYINGSLATLVTLSEIGRRLIDVYGQSEHQSLTRPDEHVEILDAYGGLENLRAHMAKACKAYVALKKELDALLHDSKSASEKREFLEFQSREIAEAGLTPGEDEELKRLKERLQNSEKIRNVTTEAEKALYSDAGSVTERLGAIAKALKELSSLDENLSERAKTLEASLFEIEDVASFLRTYSESIESDSDGLENVVARIDLIGKLKRKHGAAIEEILAKKAAIDKDLSTIANLDEKLRELEAKTSEARDTAALAAKNLSEARKNAAKELEGRIEEELSTLGMKGSVFEVSIEEEKNPDGSPRFGEKGADRVSFFIATNKGEGLKPLARIASGGELSRIMLAMKSVAAVGKVPTLIFDEIDTGVGGVMAQVVGAKLKEVSGAHQVLCITHLPQIAAFGDRNYAVSKGVAGQRTVTSVTELDGGQKIEEISRMLGGMKVTDTTRKQAVELMEAAAGLSAKGRKRRREG